MEAFGRFVTRLAGSIGRGIALIVFGTCTIAHAQLLTLAQHLSEVNAAPASQYVGKAPYRVVSAAEFARMKDYIQSQCVGVQSVHVFAYDEDLIVDCVDQFTQLGATRHKLNTGNWKTAPTIFLGCPTLHRHRIPSLP